jgi:hypothetical protein
VPELSAFEFEMDFKKLKRHKSQFIDQISAELIYEIHKLIPSIWNNEELPKEWNESIAVRISKKGDKTDCGNYRYISYFPTTYKLLSNILLSRLTQCAEEIIGDYQCGFRCNILTTEHKFSVRQILEKKWE